MKIRNCKIATLLGCALSVFVFAGKTSACGCDIVEGRTALTADKGQYELDLGKLSAEPEIAVSKMDGGPAAAKTDLKYEVANTGNVQLTNVRSEDLACPQSVLAVGKSMTCTAVGENRGCAVGDYVAANDAGVMVTSKGGCAAESKML